MKVMPQPEDFPKKWNIHIKLSHSMENLRIQMIPDFQHWDLADDSRLSTWPNV